MIRFAIGAACLLAACLAPSGALAQMSPEASLPKPGSVSTLGVNIHFTDPRQGEIEQIAAAGFKWVQMDFAWGGIETEGAKGQYNFSAYDGLMSRLKPYGIRPIFILDYGNDLYEKGSPTTPEARAAFARFAAAAVTHFKGQGILWEMWNEPNGGFWLPRANVEQYIALALETGKAIKAAQPTELYIGPATAGMDFTFLERCFQAGLLRYWDAVSFHPYRNSAPETAIPDFERVKSLIAQYGPRDKHIPILSGEWGYSELYPGLSLALQSRYISREYLTNMSNDLIVSIWYDWHDDGTDPKEEEHHFGTVYPDYKPKPTYAAARTLCQALGGLRFNKRLALANPNDYCLLFSNDSGKVTLAVWTTELKPHVAALPASVGAFDKISNLGERSAVSADATGLHLEISDSPVYLTPQGDNKLLALAAEWKTIPRLILASTGNEAVSRLGMSLNSVPRSPNIVVGFRVKNLTLSNRKDFQWGVITTSARLIPVVNDLDWEKRRKGGMRYRITMVQPDGAQVSQETLILPTQPLVMTASPAQGDRLPVSIDNPTGAAITGRVRLQGAAAPETADVLFRAGEKHKQVTLHVPARANGEYRVQLAFEEEERDVGGIDGWETTLTSPAMVYQPYETFGAFRVGAPPPTGNFALEPDGDPKVRSRLAVTVENAPPGLPGAPRKALRVEYQFDAGWKFLRLAPRGQKHEPLAGEPTAFGLWAFGDESGDVFNIRYIDSSGQTFQTTAGAIDWKGWRFVQFSLEPQDASHWGGDNNGVIHYPIALDTVALIDSHDRRGGGGRVWITDLTLMRAAINK